MAVLSVPMPESQNAGKWTAFLLSLVVPGAGHVYAASFWAVPWVVISIAVPAAVTQSAEPSVFTVYLTICATILVCICSAEHARRICETKVRRDERVAIASKVNFESKAGRRIAIRITVACSCSTEQLWRRVSNLPKFLTLDSFHESVAFIKRSSDDGTSLQGGTLLLRHNAFGWRLLRTGRILSWNPGKGYAFSDLSTRNRGKGLPHVFFVSVHDAGSRGSRLEIVVRGKWTSALIPVGLGRLWSWLVCLDHARLLRKGL